MSVPPLSLQQLKLKCQHCSLKSLCIPVGLPAADIRLLEKIVNSQITIHKGKALFSQDQAFQGFYTVRSGAFKYVYQTPT